MLSQHQSIFKKIYTSWKADICQGWEFDFRLFVLSRKIAHLEKWPWAIRTFKKSDVSDSLPKFAPKNTSDSLEKFVFFTRKTISKFPSLQKSWEAIP